MNVNDFKLKQSIYTVNNEIQKEHYDLTKCSIIGIYEDYGFYLKVKDSLGNIFPLQINETGLGSNLSIRGFLTRKEAIEYRNELVQKEIKRLNKLIK